MKLRGIEFGPVLDASGVRNFFGGGYRHHKWLGPFGPRFDGSTFVSKTATAEPNEGNMPVERTEDDYMPKEVLPACVVVKLRGAHVLNAVGLTNPGLEALFDTVQWFRRCDPFFISVASIGDTRSKRMGEIEKMTHIFERRLNYLDQVIGIQVNFSCPNTESFRDRVAKESELIGEIEHALAALGSLRVPIMPKVNVLATTDLALRIAENPECDALCISNTLPFGTYPSVIPWEKIFGAGESPLLRRGFSSAGGYSGPYLLPFVAQWVSDVRRAGLKIPLNIGGGITRARDVDLLYEANGMRGNSSIFVGSVAITRPWRVRSIIRRGRELFGKEVQSAARVDYSQTR